MTSFQNGDLLLTHNYWRREKPVLSLLPGIIRTFTDSPWNHSANVLEVDGELMVVEADWPRCTIQTLTEWLAKGKKDVLVLRPHELDQEHYRKTLLDAVGVPYDPSALLEQARYHISGRRKWRGRESTASGKFYCSELSALAHRHPNWWLVWPGDFTQNGHFSVVAEYKKNELALAFA